MQLSNKINLQQALTVLSDVFTFIVYLIALLKKDLTDAIISFWKKFVQS